MKVIRVVAAVICDSMEHKTKILLQPEVTENSKAAGNSQAEK